MQFRNSSVPQTLDTLRINDGLQLEKFDSLKCAKDSVQQPININIVYEIHGKGVDLDRAKSAMVLDAAANRNSILLLESDSNQRPNNPGLRRTLAKNGFRSGYLPETVRGMDNNLQLRNIWFNEPTISAIEANPDLGVEALLEELIVNPRLAEQFRKIKLLPKHVEATQSLLFKVEQILAMSPPYTGPLKPWVVDIPDKRALVWALRNIQSLETKDDLKAHPSSLKPCGLIATPGCEKYLLHAGFNRRDKVFLNEAGVAICDAAKMGIATINISVGAGHESNLKLGLEKAIAAAGWNGKISVNSVALESWQPSRSPSRFDKVIERMQDTLE